MSLTATIDAPSATLDLFSDQALLDPYPLYSALRAQGGAVWLPALGVYAVMRYSDVKAALRDWKTFSSAQGVSLSQQINAVPTMLQSDPPGHDELRAVVGAPLTAAAVAQLKEQIQAEANKAVAQVAGQGRFDGVRDLAWHLPLTVVSQFVGLPEEARRQMLVWSEAASNLAGPVLAQPSPAYAQRAAEAMEGFLNRLRK